MSRNVAQYAQFYGSDKDKLFALIAKEEWNRLAAGYGGGPQKPAKPYEHPERYKPRLTVQASGKIREDEYSRISELIEKLQEVKGKFGDIEISVEVESDWEYVTDKYLLYTYHVPNPNYGNEKSNYDEMVESVNSFESKLASYELQLEDWKKHRDAWITSQASLRLAQWEDEFKKLMEKRARSEKAYLEVMENLSGNPLKIASLHQQLKGYTVRAQQISMLIEKYKSGWTPSNLNEKEE